MPFVIWKLMFLGAAKKFIVWSLGYTYGFPRLYRRQLEFTRYAISDVERRRRVNATIRWVYRFPGELHQKWKNL